MNKNVHTLTDTESGSNSKQHSDWKTTAGYRIDGKTVNMETDCEPISIETANPTELTPNQAFKLFENIEPRTWTTEQKLQFQSVFTSEELYGKLLLSAIKETEIKNEIIQKLKLNIKTKAEFNDFLKRLKERQDEIDKKDKATTTDSNAAIPSVAPQQPAQTKHEQNISNSKCVIGAMHNNATHQNVNNACEFNNGTKVPTT